MIILKKFIFVIIIFSFSNISAQTFQWGVRAGFGFSCYDSGETEFSNGKGDEYSIGECGPVFSYQLGIAGLLNFKNSNFYLDSELYYSKGGGEAEFTNLQTGETENIKQNDHVFELAALIGFKLGVARIFAGPSISYRISTDEAFSNYLIEEIGYMNGETNTNKIYVNIIGGLGYSIDSSTTIDFRYSLPIVEDKFTIEEGTFKNNLAFRVLSIGVVHAF